MLGIAEKHVHKLFEAGGAAPVALLGFIVSRRSHDQEHQRLAE